MRFTGRLQTYDAIAAILACLTFCCASGKIGWGGRIRTFTVLINSEVSYQLDHAPAGCLRPRFIQGRTAISGLRRKKERRSILLRYHDPALGKCPGQKCAEKTFNFFIRSGISIREGGGVRMDREVAADSHLFVFSSFIVPLETCERRSCSEVLKVPQSLQRKLQESI
jgi:hypothetical protein